MGDRKGKYLRVKKKEGGRETGVTRGSWVGGCRDD